MKFANCYADGGGREAKNVARTDPGSDEDDQRRRGTETHQEPGGRREAPQESRAGSEDQQRNLEDQGTRGQTGRGDEEAGDCQKS